MTINTTSTAVCDTCGAVYDKPDAMLAASIALGGPWWTIPTGRSHFCDWQCLDKWIAKKKAEKPV